MAVKNRQNSDTTADDALADILFEKLPTALLVDILKHRIASGQASVSDVIQGLADDKEAAVIIMKSK